MKRRILSILLAALMLLTLVPTVAFAAETEHPADEHGDWTPIDDIGDLETLFTNGGSGYLTGDVSVTANMTIAADKQVELCLNGHVLNLKKKHISVSGKLNIFDCGDTEHYFSEDNGLWTIQDFEDIFTKHTVKGGVITGGSA